MVPVALKLHNFLSYGTANEALDFEQFHVACLSGGNGQGKSALLDAITWAIWGEARKSGDSRKPDDDLLRIGQSRMEVDLTFDLDDARYRVVRAYQKSASGKTSKPTLEFQVLDPGTGEWRPLTTPSIRETQTVIDEKIGLDYNTFINSAFLLQGRSDEFTKKRPADRKQILAQILALGRYDKLADKARDRIRQYKSEGERLEAEIDRLTLALEEEGRWKEDLDAAEAHRAALDAQRAELRTEQRALVDRLSALEATAREAQHQQDTLRRLAERSAALASEHDALAAKVADTERLLGRREEIVAAQRRYEALRTERDTLDEKADLRRGVEAQLQQLTLQIEQQQRDLDFRLKQHEADLRRDTQKLEEAEGRLATRSGVEEELAKANEAQATVARLRNIAERRRSDEVEVHACQTTITAERARLEGEATQLDRALHRDDPLPERSVLESELAACAEELTAFRDARDRLTQVKEAGMNVRAEIDSATTLRQDLTAEIKALQEKRQRIDALDMEQCPTCGSVLTADHRATVRATYDAEIAGVEARADDLDQRLRAMQERRGRIGQDYRTLDAQVQQFNGVEARHATLTERLARHAQEEAERQRLTSRLAQVRESLERDTYTPEARKRLADAQARLDAQPFDQAAFEAAQTVAASLGRWEQERRTLDEVAGQAEGLRAAVERHRRTLESLRTDLHDGGSLAVPRQKQKHLREQLERIGYDAGRHGAVRQELQALAGIPEQVAGLMGAEGRLTEWRARQTILAAEQATLAEQREAAQIQLDAATQALTERAALEQQREALTARVATVDADLGETTGRCGALRARLERCASDRAALKETRAKHREVKRQRTIYTKLRTAFGKNGIPSLIIEETLPEVEARANELLDRLTAGRGGGRTQVLLETLKDKKAGGTKETLDINITDEHGVARAYETYSGGEAFRVNFALRLALAQLLAERSGVRIRTLVVDEGFGTQDKQGLHSLVEAINAVRDDFDKILVITHLDELKEAFPVRIEVEKHPVEGSRFTVLGV
ncbi:MAG: SMC family ATPase [Bacteroidota bacterium]